MADFEAPSFSLGFDFDLPDSEPEPEPKPQQTTTIKTPTESSLASGSSVLEDANDNEFETLMVVDSESENDEVLRPKLKRLRRGYVAENDWGSGSGKKKVDLDSVMNLVDVDDDIEDFDFDSPQDNHKDAPFSTQHYSVCNSSKIPLDGNGVLTKQSGKKKQCVSSGPDSVITSCNKPPFPKLTVSPLRRFQLIDSDSDPDDPFVSEGATKKNYKESESYMNLGQPNLTKRVGLSEHRNLNKSTTTFAQKDLWEDFRPQKTRIPTPALDEVCEEYFSSLKDKNTSQSNTVKSNQKSHVTNSVIDLGDPQPPAHQYFFHHDPRVRELVRTRLPNFFPLNAANRDSEPSTSNIDYMGQFSHGEKPKQGARTNKSERSAWKNSRKSKAPEMSQGFMNPKGNTRKEIPKDAGKRRVQADGQASGSGHWFTGSDGKRVYVSKNGQEHTGRAAYILHKKESGGFKNKRAKKTSTKKK